PSAFLSDNKVCVETYRGSGNWYTICATASLTHYSSASVYTCTLPMDTETNCSGGCAYGQECKQVTGSDDSLIAGECSAVVPDTDLETIIGYQIPASNREYSTLSVASLRYLSTLPIFNPDVTSLEGIRHAIFLKELTFSSIPLVTDLSIVSTLTNLEKLTVTGCELTSWGFSNELEGFPYLYSLIASSSNLKDSYLEELFSQTPSMTDVDIGSNDDLTSVEPLIPILSTLDYLNINGLTNVPSLSPLYDSFDNQQNTVLTNLHLDNSSISASEVVHFPNLTILFMMDMDVHNNDLVAISQYLTNLTYLYLSNNPISDLSPLQTLQTLIYMICEDCYTCHNDADTSYLSASLFSSLSNFSNYGSESLCQCPSLIGVDTVAANIACVEDGDGSWTVGCASNSSYLYSSSSDYTCALPPSDTGCEHGCLYGYECRIDPESQSHVCLPVIPDKILHEAIDSLIADSNKISIDSLPYSSLYASYGTPSNTNYEDYSSLYSVPSLQSIISSSQDVVLSWDGEYSTDIDGNGGQISRLDGIEHLSALIGLDLPHNTISDASVLSSMTNLQQIDISHNPDIPDILFISDLHALTHLSVHDNPIISSFPADILDLSSLSSLDISNTAISDLSMLLPSSIDNGEVVYESNTSIVELNISGTSISSPNLLSWFGVVEVLSIGRLGISNWDLTHLFQLPLTYLDVSNNSISDISFFSEFESLLDTLILDDNKICGFEESSTTLVQDSLHISNVSHSNQDTSECSFDGVEYWRPDCAVFSYRVDLSSSPRCDLPSDVTTVLSCGLNIQSNPHEQCVLQFDDSGVSSVEIACIDGWYGAECSDACPSDPIDPTLSDVLCGDDSTLLTGSHGTCDLLSHTCECNNSFSGSACEYYSFRDANFQSALCVTLLGYSPCDISPYDLLSVTSLDVSGSDISDISGIELLENLTSLDISDNENLVDISELDELSNLTFLDISSTDVQSLSSLEALFTSIDTLIMSNTDIPTSDIVLFTTLSYLDVSDCGLDSLAFVLQLPGLEGLNASNNAIQDISPVLSTLSTSLIELDISGNLICGLDSAFYDTSVFTSSFTQLSSFSSSDNKCSCSDFSYSEYVYCAEIYPYSWGAVCSPGSYRALTSSSSPECVPIASSDPLYSTCYSALSSHQECVLDEDSGVISLQCLSDWYGAECSDACPVYNAQQCGGDVLHGVCNTETHECECSTSYTGSACQLSCETCIYGECAYMTDEDGNEDNSTVDPSSEYMICSPCSDQWYGDMCDCACPLDPFDLSSGMCGVESEYMGSHGACNSASHLCECEDEYEGDACEYVHFADEYIHSAVCDLLSKDSSSCLITPQEMLDLPEYLDLSCSTSSTSATSTGSISGPLTGLSLAKNTIYISFSGCGNLNDIQGIELLESLEEINLSGCSDSIDISPLVSLSESLSSIDLSGTSLSQQTIDQFSSFSNLKTLVLNDCSLESCPDLCSSSESLSLLDLVSLSESLSSIDLSGTSLSQQTIDQFSSFSNLKTLVLNDCSLESCPDLCSSSESLSLLDLGSNSLQTIDALSCLVTISSLDISYNMLYDLSPLSSMDSLTLLDISGNYVINLTDMYSLSDHLEYIDLVDNLLGSDMSCSDLSLVFPTTLSSEEGGQSSCNEGIYVGAQAQAVTSSSDTQCPNPITSSYMCYVLSLDAEMNPIIEIKCSPGYLRIIGLSDLDCTAFPDDTDDSILDQCQDTHYECTILSEESNTVSIACSTGWYGDDCSVECPIDESSGDVCGEYTCDTQLHECQCPSGMTGALCTLQEGYVSDIDGIDEELAAILCETVNGVECSGDNSYLLDSLLISDLSSIKYLEIPSAVSSIQGIDLCENLEALVIQDGSDIDDYSPIASLDDLLSLTLPSNTTYSDIQSIASTVTALKESCLSESDSGDSMSSNEEENQQDVCVSSCVGLCSLRSLTFHDSPELGNPTDDTLDGYDVMYLIDFLAQYTYVDGSEDSSSYESPLSCTLTSFSMVNCDVSDLGIVYIQSSLMGIIELCLDGNNISDLSSIAYLLDSMENLESLSIQDNIDLPCPASDTTVCLEYLQSNSSSDIDSIYIVLSNGNDSSVNLSCGSSNSECDFETSGMVCSAWLPLDEQACVCPGNSYLDEDFGACVSSERCVGCGGSRGSCMSSSDDSSGETSSSCVCSDGWYGDTCSSYCPVNELTSQECSGSPRGTCDVDTHTCQCATNFLGDACELYCDSIALCGSHGQCIPSESCESNDEFQCSCEDGWYGSSCQTQLPTDTFVIDGEFVDFICGRDYSSASVSASSSSSSSNETSASYSYLSDSGTNTCTCSLDGLVLDSSSETCIDPASHPTYSVIEGNDTACVGCGIGTDSHGSCEIDSETLKATCTCDFGWNDAIDDSSTELSGTPCSLNVCYYSSSQEEDDPESTSATIACNSHGVCALFAQSSEYGCVCDDGWHGDICSLEDKTPVVIYIFVSASSILFIGSIVFVGFILVRSRRRKQNLEKSRSESVHGAEDTTLPSSHIISFPSVPMEGISQLQHFSNPPSSPQDPSHDDSVVIVSDASLGMAETIEEDHVHRRAKSRKKSRKRHGKTIVVRKKSTRHRMLDEEESNNVVSTYHSSDRSTLDGCVSEESPMSPDISLNPLKPSGTKKRKRKKEKEKEKKVIVSE
ncbi:hypothetical protein ADUPG1_009269, partial [Aduncisulcus paluster]